MENAQDLIVRFGLHPIWHRKVGVLSTGEIRKVLLTHAISKQPELLFLDRAFDGLDFASRAVLKWMLDDLASGMQTRPLVHNVAFKKRPPIELFMVSHRPNQEFISAVSRVLKVLPGEQGAPFYGSGVVQESSPKAVFSEELLQKPVVDVPLRKQDIDAWVRATPREVEALDDDNLVADFRKVDLFAQDGEQILKDISWVVRQGERWFLEGHNGAGKVCRLCFGCCKVDLTIGLFFVRRLHIDSPSHLT